MLLESVPTQLSCQLHLDLGATVELDSSMFGVI